MRLSDYLALHGLTRVEFGRRIGSNKQAVGRYVSGQNIPGREMMVKIVQETGGVVMPNDFYVAEREAAE